MDSPAASRYCAFISYSSSDRAWAEWLQRAIETFVFPSPLVHMQTPLGRIERRLGRVFRDTHTIVVGENLSQGLKQGLQYSRALIVLCSKAAANSPVVNREIEYFKSLPGNRPILPVIIEECSRDTIKTIFPRALGVDLHDVDNSSLLDANAELPVAADVRKGHGGKYNAKLRIMAGLVGLPVVELRDYADRAERRKRRLTTGLAATFFCMLVVAVGALYWANSQATIATEQRSLAEARLSHVAEVSNKYLVSVVAQSDRLEIPASQTLELFSAINSSISFASRNDSSSTALRELKAELSLRSCDVYQKLGNYIEWEIQAAKAVQQFQALLADVPAADRSRSIAYDRKLAASHYQYGLVLQSRGQTIASREHFKRAADIRRKIVAFVHEATKSPPGTFGQLPSYDEVRRELSAAYLMLGEGFLQEGHPDRATHYIVDAMTIRRQLAAEVEAKLEGVATDATARTQAMSLLRDRRRDLAMAHYYLGEAELHEATISAKKSGDLNAARGPSALFARDSVTTALTLRSELHREISTSLVDKRHYARSLNQSARLSMLTGDYDEALAHNSRALEFMRAVARSDHNNYTFNANLASVEGDHGLILREAKRTQDALHQFRTAAGYFKKLLDLQAQKPTDPLLGIDPAKIDLPSQRSLAYWRYQEGATLAELGLFDDAAAVIAPLEDILNKLNDLNPGNAEWRSDLTSLLELHTRINAQLLAQTRDGKQLVLALQMAAHTLGPTFQ